MLTTSLLIQQQHQRRTSLFTLIPIVCDHSSRPTLHFRCWVRTWWKKEKKSVDKILPFEKGYPLTSSPRHINACNAQKITHNDNLWPLLPQRTHTGTTTSLSSWNIFGKNIFPTCFCVLLTDIHTILITNTRTV